MGQQSLLYTCIYIYILYILYIYIYIIYMYIYIYIYLEPVCPLFWGETTLQKKAETPINTGFIWVQILGVALWK